MAIAAAEESSHDPQNIDDDTELQQVLAENARLRQHIHHASVNGPGFFLDQDYPQDDNYGAAATATGQRMGTTLLPQAAQSAYAGPPPTYVYQGAPIGAIFQSAPTGGRVQAKTTPLITPSGGLGAEYYGTHASQAQGQQLTTLLTSHSYTAYSKSHPDDARTLSTMLNVRDNLCVAQHNGALALGGLQDPSTQDPSTPLYAPLMDSIQSIEICIPATKEVVNQLSQRMLFAGRDIGPEAMKLRGDLALHNSINPENQINCKELKELQDMSKRVDRQTAQNELALSAGPGRAPTRFQARNPYARWQGQAGAELPVPAQLPGPAIGVGSGPAQGQRNPASVLCYNCQTMGHYANKCPMPKIRPGGPPASPWCGLLSLTLISLFLCVPHTPNAHTFPLLTDYVQQWITGFLLRGLPVSDDLVLHLSERACSRLALDALLAEWASLAQDWEEERNCRPDRMTKRQHQIKTRWTELRTEIHSAHSPLTSSCFHPSYAPPPFKTTPFLSCFCYPALCTLCLSPPPGTTFSAPPSPP